MLLKFKSRGVVTLYEPHQNCFPPQTDTCLSGVALTWAICPYLLPDLKCKVGRFECRVGRFE
eukprot:COSAG06_NODE_20979_length_774_cov_1.922963_1_plen_61_part_10